MLETYLRAPIQKVFIAPVIKRWSTWTVPNWITAAACFCGLLTTASLGLQLTWFALFFLLLSGYLDMLDGSLARAQKVSSAFGTMLDIVSDRIVEFSVIFGLYLYHPSSRAALCLLMLGSVFICITSFLVVGVFTENSSEKGFHYSPGLMERAEAFIFFGLMILMPSWFTLLACSFILLVFATAFYRVYEFSQQRIAHE